MNESNCPVCKAQAQSKTANINRDYRVVEISYSCGSKLIADTIGGHWTSNLKGPCSQKRRR